MSGDTGAKIRGGHFPIAFFSVSLNGVLNYDFVSIIIIYESI